MTREERFGCETCWPPAAEDARRASEALTQGPRIVDDSHLGVTIRSCAQCRQLFVAVFAEQVDWQDGDDSQYWTLMPLAEAEVEALAALDERAAVEFLNALPKERRCLQDDRPKGGPRRLAWGHGLLIAA